MAKIYTSRFFNPELKNPAYVKVGIVRSLPKHPLPYSIYGNIFELSPQRGLINESDREVFKKRYFAQLNSLGIESVRRRIDAFEKCGNIVLLCYEDVRKPNEWCHRTFFAEWYYNHFGKAIEELADTSKAPKHSPFAMLERISQKTEQLGLFDFLS